MFEEQVSWAADGESTSSSRRPSRTSARRRSLDVIKQAAFRAVVTLTAHQSEETRTAPVRGGASSWKRRAPMSSASTAVRARDHAAAAPEIREAVSVHVAALPVPYRTHEEEPTFQSLRDTNGAELPGGMPFPTALDPFTCNRYEIAQFARDANDLGVGYIGLCCGAAPHHLRSLAEAPAGHPPRAASRPTCRSTPTSEPTRA